jgi:hypothetical protein
MTQKACAVVVGYVLHCIRRPGIFVAPLLQEIDAGGGRRDKLGGKAEARLRLLCLTPSIVASGINSEQ